MADERIPKAVDAGVKRRHWRTIIIFALGVAAFLAAIFAVKSLNHHFWVELWNLQPVVFGWKQTSFYRSDSHDGGLKDIEVRASVLAAVVYALPVLMLAIALWWRLRPAVVLGLGCVTPMIVVTLGLIFLSYHPPYEDFLPFAVGGVLMGLIGMVLARMHQRPPEVDEHREIRQKPAGVARHPWRTWIILTYGFFALLSVMPFADYVNGMIWEVIGLWWNSMRWGRSPYLRDIADDYDFEVIRFSTGGVVMFVLPFLLLVLAMKLRMRPWCGWILGFLLVGVDIGFYYLLSPMELYRSLTMSLLIGQCSGAVMVLLLWLYHAKVSKIRYVPDDEDFV